MSALSAALPRLRGRVRVSALAAPELLLLLGGTALLNLWQLGINGWANTYYSAAVRSMASSWHDFLFASMDRSGLMTVDKPPLALWVQALSARVFGFHPLSILVPQALMGVVAVGLVYDLVRRRFGRLGGFVGGAVFALTPMTVALARHNNTDELLVLCSVAAVWSAVRALDSSRLRWLVLSGICVGLGFETKMAIALVVVPGIVAAWMLFAPGRRVRGLAGFGAATVLVGGAWPLLVTLTPAADRPWISGTSDNSIWSLIFGYNGLGRVAGQSGGPQAFGGRGGGGTFFGGSTGMFRLLHLGLGDQAGWLLGFALVMGLGLLVLTRLRRWDPRSGWLVVVGGAFVVTAVVFSFAHGIFHPYYVSLLAPFAAALVGAGTALALSAERRARLILALAVIAGAVTELVVLNEISGRLSWATPLVVVAALVAAGLLVRVRSARHVAVVITAALAALLAAPTVWAADTLGHAANGTFPAGGPANADGGGPGGFARGSNGRGPGRLGSGRFPGGPPSAPGGALGAAPGAPGLVPGAGVVVPGAGVVVPGAGGVVPGAGGVPGGSPGVAGAVPGGAPGAGAVAPGGPGGPGGFAGDTASLTAALRYAAAHGGGTLGVASQSTAAAAILSSDANAAGLGGFSGRESAVSPAWLAMEVRAGRLRWVLVGGGSGFGPPGDTRTGSQAAMQAAAKACRAVSLPSTGTRALYGRGASTLYDCRGRGAAIARAA